jgi:hypothetical protein
MERQMDAIFEATKKKCIEWQDEGRKSHDNVEYYLESRHLSPMLRSVLLRHQYEAAHHHEQMRVRLERLIGVS